MDRWVLLITDIIDTVDW